MPAQYAAHAGSPLGIGHPAVHALGVALGKRVVQIAMGLLDRFVSRFAHGKSAPVTSPTSIVQVQTILQAYSRVLERSAPAPGTVADAARLPYPKETIESAILFALRVAEDEELRADLRQSFLDLARWQEGVAPAGRRSGFRGASTAQADGATTPGQEPAAMLQADLDRLIRKLQDSGFAG